MGHRFYITGCARSGTTLLRRLFNAFAGLSVCNGQEMKVEDFIRSDYDVAKRCSMVVLSDQVPMHRQRSQLGALRAAGAKVVNVTRGREATLLSGYTSPGRYEACAQQAEKWASAIDWTFTYESLLARPDFVQRAFAERFGLGIEHLWSAYPSFIDSSEESAFCLEGRYGLRPIGAPPEPIVSP